MFVSLEFIFNRKKLLTFTRRSDIVCSFVVNGESVLTKSDFKYIWCGKLVFVGWNLKPFKVVACPTQLLSEIEHKIKVKKHQLQKDSHVFIPLMFM